MPRAALSAVAVLSLILPIHAQDEIPKMPRADEPAPEVLPPPRPVEPLPELILPQQLPPWRPQPGTREVWQYYGVDRSGRFLPRVVLAPAGSYYLYNGQPYPWTTTRPTLHMPYVLE